MTIQQKLRRLPWPFRKLGTDAAHLIDAVSIMEKENREMREKLIQWEVALHSIAARTTPGANATVRSMARIAEEALQ